VDLLRRPEEATIAQIQEATGWQPHTARAAITGLKKKGPWGGHRIARRWDARLLPSFEES
jgi:Protein of unknown function (DUF3489)